MSLLLEETDNREEVERVLEEAEDLLEEVRAEFPGLTSSSESVYDSDSGNSEARWGSNRVCLGLVRTVGGVNVEVVDGHSSSEDTENETKRILQQLKLMTDSEDDWSGPPVVTSDEDQVTETESTDDSDDGRERVLYVDDVRERYATLEGQVNGSSIRTDAILSVEESVDTYQNVPGVSVDTYQDVPGVSSRNARDIVVEAGVCKNDQKVSGSENDQRSQRDRGHEQEVSSRYEQSVVGMNDQMLSESGNAQTTQRDRGHGQEVSRGYEQNVVFGAAVNCMTTTSGQTLSVSGNAQCQSDRGVTINNEVVVEVNALDLLSINRSDITQSDDSSYKESDGLSDEDHGVIVSAQTRVGVPYGVGRGGGTRPTVGQPTDQTLQDELESRSGGKLSDCDEGEETNE